MERRQLEYFVAIAEHGGFKNAARRLRIAQPSLSQAVRALEQDLGTQLFHRHSQGVTLTAAGQALIEPAQHALRAFATARSRVDDVNGLLGGRLDIVALTTLAVDPLAQIIGRFRQLHPLVDVRIDDPEQDSAVTDMVRTGRSEFGLTESATSSEGLHKLRLPDQEYLAVLPPRVGLPPEDSPITVEDLAELPLIAPPPGTAMRALIDEQLTFGGVLPRVAIDTAHRAAIVPLVLAGAGAAVLPRTIADDARLRGADVRATVPPLTRQVFLVWRSALLSPAAAAFLKLIERQP